MNLIHYLDQDLHQNSLDVLLGLSPSLSPLSSQCEPEYDFGSVAKNCETFDWIWQDVRSDLDTSSKHQEIQIIEMKHARTDQQSRIKQYLNWIQKMIPSDNMSQMIKPKKRIKKINRKNK